MLSYLVFYCASVALANGRSSPVSAARDLLYRFVPPEHRENFTLSVLPAASGADKFQVHATAGQVTIAGSNGVAIASGFYHYLKHFLLVLQCFYLLSFFLLQAHIFTITVRCELGYWYKWHQRLVGC